MLLYCSVATIAEGTQPRERRVRTIQFNTRPIAESLRPDDDIVIVEWPQDLTSVWDREPTLLEHLKIEVLSPTATTAIVSVTGVSGVLAMENSWIHTKFVGTVDEVLKTGTEVGEPDRVTRGQPIEFYVHGGEAAVGGVIVRAKEQTQYPIRRKYLIFLDQKNVENGWGLNSAPLLIDGDTFAAVPPTKSKVSGFTIGEVRKIAKENR